MIKPIDAKSILPWESSANILNCEKKWPSLTIVIPIYNSGSFLEKTLRSLMFNDLHNVEIIVQDACSTDETHSIIEHYKNLFSKVKIEKDAGQSDAINRGMLDSKGDILYWLNGDDILLQNSIYYVKKYFNENKNCDVLVGNAFLTEIDFTPIKHFKFNTENTKFESLINYATNHLIQPSVFFSRKAWENCGPLETDDHYAMDANLFISMSHKYEFMTIDQDFAYSVFHEGCKTRKDKIKSVIALSLVQAFHGRLDLSRNTLMLIKDDLVPLEQADISRKIVVTQSDSNEYKMKLELISDALINLDLTEVL
jgi:glycosyltransferase involved in cell wall biosynthesis